MKMCGKLILVLLAASAIGSNGLAVGKITVDPNAPGTRVENGDAGFDDSEDRLAQKVTLHVMRARVANILSVLSKQTGVDLRAGINEKDWQVRDRKMNIFCKDLPLSNLMNSIARVMKFKWSKEKTKSGAYAYRLYMDRKSLLDQEAQREREEERRLKAETERREKALGIFAKTAEMSDAELAKLRTESPMAYLVASSGLAKSVGGLFAESPSLFQALASGQSASISANSLSPQGQGFLADTWRGLHKIMSTVGVSRPDLPGDLDSAAADAIIKINPNLDLITNTPRYLIGMIQISPQDGRVMVLPVIDPESRIGKLLGEIMLESIETGKTAEDAKREIKNMEDRLVSAFLADMKADSAPEPDKLRPEDPALLAKVKIKPDSHKLEDVLAAVAEASGISIVSDSFRMRFHAFIPPKDEVELGKLLEKIEDGFRYDWEKLGAVIEFRDKKWFAKRAAQIPDAWIEAWREKLKKTGTLELGDIAQICSLTPEQFDENVAEDTELLESGVSVNYYSNKDIMRLYGCLSESQRAAAFAQAGLDLASLSPEQWEKAAKAITSEQPALLEEQIGPLTLKIETVQNRAFLDPPRSKERRSREVLRWHFKIFAGDQAKQAVWRVHAPSREWLEDARKTARETQKKAGETKPEPH